MRPDPPAVPAIAPTRSPALSSRELSTPPSPAGASQPLSVRPKLNLAKRTLTEADSSAASTSSTETKPSPFGAAKPIDTAAREKEVEEKRQIALREKKEAEDRAREEKRLADEKSREEKRLAKETEKTKDVDKDWLTQGKKVGHNAEKENGVGSVPPTVAILRRPAVENSDATEAVAGDEGANGSVVEDTAVKPKEIIRDMSTKTEGNGIPNGTSSPQISSSTDTTAKALEDDGWSTVSKPRNNRRNGNQGARAIAS